MARTPAPSSEVKPPRMDYYRSLDDDVSDDDGNRTRRRGWICCGAPPQRPSPATAPPVAHAPSAASGAPSSVHPRHQHLMVHERAAQNIVPETYLLNKASCLRELDAALGHSGPPAVEYVFVESLLPDFGNRWVGVGFGHAAVRYTLPSGQQRLVNVTRGGAGGVESDTPLVQIYEDPADYYFGSNGNGGIFSRSVCLVRVQHWDADSVLAMDHWFRGVAHAFQRVNEDAQAKVGFNHCGALLDTARVVLGLSETGITGNCSNWTSQAMVLGGLSKRIHSFPKAILVDMVDHLLLDRARKDADKAREPLVQIAYLDRAGQLRRPKPSSVRHAVWHSMVAPFYLLKTWLYWVLCRYGDVIVSMEAVAADAGQRTVGVIVRCVCVCRG
mmetsp:Transcript_5052/g.14881  ORF Transcript_5052/g.14881 Transcript_5052/m.14881 type:complete len:386 (+) Transcript_5052:23-1180(+)